MREMDRERIVKQMFPDWREHLNDGRVLDNILKGLSRREKPAEYMRACQRRKATNAKKLRFADTDSDQKARGRVTPQFGM